MNYKVFDVIVIGAGPAGIFAAITAAKTGSKVLLIEKNDQIGRKILATGNGRCNITNRNATVENYHGATKEFVGSVLNRYSSGTTIQYFESLGLMLKEEDKGRMFPRTNQASSVVEILKIELDKQNIDVLLNTTVKSIRKEGNWFVCLENGQIFSSKSLVLTTGGKAAYQLGSSGDGLHWSETLGHTLIPIAAALVPIDTIETWPTKVQGVKIEGTASAIVNGKTLSTKHGDILFTHYGLSGPAIMALAGSISRSSGDVKAEIMIDIFPEYTFDELSTKITLMLANSGKKSVKNSLIGVLPTSLLELLLDLVGIDSDRRAAEMPKAQRLDFITLLKELKLTVKSVRSLKEAQVSSGGINTNEVDPITLSSNVTSGLYFAGEILDVDGASGGYNLQWAWSSGFVAGEAAAKFAKK
jgi:hypothetical protein